MEQAVVPAGERPPFRWRILHPGSWCSPLPRPDSRARLVVDLLGGAAVPVVLLHLDQRWLPTFLMDTTGILPLRPYSPLLAFACIASLLVWYPFRRREGWVQALGAGPLLLGAVFAGGIALVLLPLSLMGALFLGIGLLGLLPFLTAAVFGGAGLRAFAAGRAAIGTGPAVALALLAACTFGGACLGAGRVVRMVEIRETQVLAGERQGDPERAERRLRLLYAFPGVSLRGLGRNGLRDFDGAEGDARSRRSREAWERITGRRLEYFD